MRKIKIVVAFNSRDGLLKEYRRRFGDAAAEDEIPPDFFAEGDSPNTIQAVREALESNGHQVECLEADDTFPSRLAETGTDMVFNMAEGLFGDFRESYIPLICERQNIPYSGSEPLTLAICLNKARTKEILSYYNIPNAPFRICAPGNVLDLDGFEFPAIVKPVSEGSSKGVFNDSIVHSRDEALNKIEKMSGLYHQTVLIEKFLSGHEFTVAMWGNGHEAEVLPFVAIDHTQLPETANAIYSYEAKWEWDTPDNPLAIFKCPVDIPHSLSENIEAVVRKAYAVFHVRDWCRIDIRLDENGIPNIIEINPLPGILPDPRENSCFPKAARAAGYSYEEMINNVVSFVTKRRATL